MLEGEVIVKISRGGDKDDVGVEGVDARGGDVDP